MKAKQKVTIHELYDILEDAIKDFPEGMIQAIHKKYNDPFFTTVATLLSARTKDTTTEPKLPKIYEKAHTPQQFLDMPLEELEQLLFPIGFYKTKANNIKKLSKIVRDELNGEIPKSVEGLIKLPGVGIKTANLVADVAFEIPAICVDTHVHRIMNHLGYVDTKSPNETEKALKKKLPIELWRRTNSILVIVGQYMSNHVKIKDPDNILNQYELIEEK